MGEGVASRSPGRPSFPEVVFVYGALRSGTTLLRLMLDSHPLISNPGEYDFLFDYIEFGDDGSFGYDVRRLNSDRIFVDFLLARGLPSLSTFDVQTMIEAIFGNDRRPIRTLNIHRNLGMALKVFEGARFIHVVRNPVAVAESSRKMGWGGNLYSAVGHWLETEDEWAMAGLPPERCVEVRFEELLSDPGSQLKRICKFLGVEYDAAMLTYPNRSTYAKPDQVRAQAATEVSDWTIPYLAWRCSDRLRSLGYTVNALAVEPSLFIRKVIMVESKLRNFAFGSRRYGIGLTLAHRLLRQLPDNPIKHYVFAKIADYDRRALK